MQKLCLGYIDVNNIKVNFLTQDRSHQNEIGKSSLGHNFINFTNG